MKRSFPTLIKKIPKLQQIQANLFCQDCALKVCSEQDVGCRFRLATIPNYLQKRKIRSEAVKAEKRANETGRTKYWRERGQRLKVKKILEISNA